MYKCICGFETSSSNKLKQHKEKCNQVLLIIDQAPLCFCGKKLDSVFNKGTFIGYRKSCGKKECYSLAVSKRITGVVWTDEHKKNHNKSKLKDNIIKYGNFKCVVCNKIFETNTALRAHKASCHDIFKCILCNKIFKNNAGLQTHFLYKHDNSDHAVFIKDKQIKIGRLIQENNRQKYVSNLEKYFENILKEFNVNYIKQFRLKNKNQLYFYDFYIPENNLVIEVDGDYWHINPKKYQLNEMSQYIQEYKKIEIEKEAYLINNGYNIIRFWEDDIQNNIEDVKGRLKDAIS